MQTSDASPQEPATSGQSLPKPARLRSSAEFERVYARRCKAGNGTLLLFGAVNERTITRLGLSVSRRLGGAVVRNRLKRLLREAFRRCRSELPPGLDLIAIPTAAERAGLEAYVASLVRLARKVERRLRDDAAEGPRA
jgi:ribonuclease P protein component